jgi:hypothetical protein
MADLYRPGHEPRDVVEAREREDERELVEMEATDSEDQRFPARRAAGSRSAAAVPQPGPQVVARLAMQRARLH